MLVPESSYTLITGILMTVIVLAVFILIWNDVSNDIEEDDEIDIDITVQDDQATYDDLVTPEEEDGDEGESPKSGSLK